jgi:hypothetical protein
MGEKLTRKNGGRAWACPGSTLILAVCALALSFGSGSAYAAGRDVPLVNPWPDDPETGEDAAAFLCLAPCELLDAEQDDEALLLEEPWPGDSVWRGDSPLGDLLVVSNSSSWVPASTELVDPWPDEVEEPAVRSFELQE